MDEMTLTSPFGPLTLGAEGGQIVALRWGGGPDDKTPLLSEAAGQLAEYFAGSRRGFDLPIAFQPGLTGDVMRAMCAIPFGETRTYGEMATFLKKPQASRAVGAANGRNRLAIVVPCHRLIGADGSLTGYGGGQARKAALLRLERQAVPH